MNWRYGRTILLGLTTCLLLVYCAVSVFGADPGAVLRSLLMSVALLAWVIFSAALVIVIVRWLRFRWCGTRARRGSARRRAG